MFHFLEADLDLMPQERLALEPQGLGEPQALEGPQALVKLQGRLPLALSSLA
jgi:hypothetical protein